MSSLRDRVLRRDRHCCVYCGEAFGAEDLTLDHVQPRMRGGDSSAGNLVTSCRSCNTAKGGQAAWSYLAKSPERREQFLKAVQESDERHAQRVWARHVRAIEEAARATLRPRSPSQM